MVTKFPCPCLLVIFLFIWFSCIFFIFVFSEPNWWSSVVMFLLCCRAFDCFVDNLAVSLAVPPVHFNVCSRTISDGSCMCFTFAHSIDLFLLLPFIFFWNSLWTFFSKRDFVSSPFIDCVTCAFVLRLGRNFLVPLTARSAGLIYFYNRRCCTCFFLTLLLIWFTALYQTPYTIAYSSWRRRMVIEFSILLLVSQCHGVHKSVVEILPKPVYGFSLLYIYINVYYNHWVPTVRHADVI